MNITLTETEANNLIALLDVATKAGGLQVAAAALPLVAKIQEASQAPLSTTTSTVSFEDAA